MCSAEFFFAARGPYADGKTANFERFWYFSRHGLAVNGSNQLKMVEKDKVHRIFKVKTHQVRPSETSTTKSISLGRSGSKFLSYWQTHRVQPKIINRTAR